MPLKTMIDAYLLRSLIRRCNYDVDTTRAAMQAVFLELLDRDVNGSVQDMHDDAPALIAKYQERFEATNMVDAVILPHLDWDTVKSLSDDHLRRLNQMMEEMLDHPPFPIISVHDEFRCHANHMNVLRQQYINIFAEMAESTILDDIMSQLHGVSGTYSKLTPNLSEKIRQSNYAIC